MAGMMTKGAEPMPGMSPTGDHDANRPMSPHEGFRSARLAVQPGVSAAIGKETPATPEEQAEYERASEAVQTAFYEGKTADGLASMLSPDEKVGSVAKAAMFALTSLDNEHDFDESVMAQITEEVADRVIEVYEAKTGDEFSEPESQAVLGSVWEGLMEVYGITPEQYADFTQGLDDKGFEGFEQEYQGYLKNASAR